MGLIVYSCPYVPAELIVAYGLTPSRILPESTGLNGPIDVTAGVCPYMRGFVNTACTMSGVTGIILTTVCDQMRHAKDYIEQRTAIPSFLLNVPSTWQIPSVIKLYISELKRLGNFLETMGGKSPATDYLWRVMEEYTKKREKLRALRADLNAMDYSMTIAEFNRTGQIMHALPGRIAEENKVPVALIGGPLTIQDFNLFNLIRHSGGNVVLDGTESGERTMPAPFNGRRSEKDDSLLELASCYFGHIPDAFRRPNSELYKWLKREIDCRGIKGVILVRHIWCDKWHAKVPRLREWLKIPFLDVDIDGESSAIRTAGRIQAFMETVS